MTDGDIIAAILGDEGAFSDKVIDKGGPTKYGITMPTLSAWRERPVARADIEALTLTEARDILTEGYLHKPGFSTLTNWRVRYAVADFGVNSGPARATRYLQRALGVPEDGRLGPLTIERASTADPVALAVRVCVLRNGFLARWAANNLEDRDRDNVPDNLEQLPGIIDRVGRILERVVRP